MAAWAAWARLRAGVLDAGWRDSAGARNGASWPAWMVRRASAWWAAERQVSRGSLDDMANRACTPVCPASYSEQMLAPEQPTHDAVESK